MSFDIAEILFLLTASFSWWLGFYSIRQKTIVTRSPLINLESATFNSGMAIVIAMYFLLPEAAVPIFLPWISLGAMIALFYCSESNNESFWRKKRNLVFGSLFFGIINVVGSLFYADPLIISSVHLLLLLRKSFLSLTLVYQSQINDFKGLKDKLRMAEAYKFNASVENSEGPARHEISTDKISA